MAETTTRLLEPADPARVLEAEADEHERAADEMESRAMLHGEDVDPDAIAEKRSAAGKARFRAQSAARRGELAAAAERQARLRELAGEIEAYAAGSDAVAEIEGCLAVVRRAARRIGLIAERHNSVVVAFDARAVALGVGAMPPGGTREGDGGIGRAGGGVVAGELHVRKFPAVDHLAAVAAQGEPAAVPPVVAGRSPSTRPAFLLLSTRSGGVFSLARLGPGHVDQVRKGEALLLGPDEIGAFMRGELVISPELIGRAQQAQPTRLAGIGAQ